MKKNRIILLTVLIMILIYVGAVVFITKPDALAYSNIVGAGTRQNQPLVTVPASAVDQEALAQALLPVLKEEINKDIDAKYDSMVAQVLKEIESTAVPADAITDVDSLIPKLVPAVVAELEKNLPDYVPYVSKAVIADIDKKQILDSLIPILVPTVVAELEKNLDAYAPYVAKAVVSELSDVNGELVSNLLTFEDALADEIAVKLLKYKDDLIQIITPDVVLDIMDLLEEEVFSYVSAVPGVPAMAKQVKVQVNMKGSEPKKEIAPLEVTTKEPVVISISTTESPTPTASAVAEPTPVVEPVVAEPTPEPVVVEPTPEPVVVEPTPEPVVAEPELAVTEMAPGPVVVEEPAPAPVVTEPVIVESSKPAEITQAEYEQEREARRQIIEEVLANLTE